MLSMYEQIIIGIMLIGLTLLTGLLVWVVVVIVRTERRIYEELEKKYEELEKKPS